VEGVIDDRFGLVIGLGGLVHPGHDPLDVEGVLAQEYLRAEDSGDVVHDRVLALAHVPEGSVPGLADAGYPFVRVYFHDDRVGDRGGAQAHFHRL
jgi:hypothetical protein